MHVLCDDGSEYDEVLIQEAAPEATSFQTLIMARLKKMGWQNVVVITEW